MSGEGPTLKSELRRGFNLFNLSVGVGTAFLFAAISIFVLDFSVMQAAIAGVAVFLLITILHASTHAYFGWRFERGLKAHHLGHHSEAVRLLSPLLRKGMHHYDETGAARSALTESKSRLPRL